jgi:hypothetical protein
VRLLSDFEAPDKKLLQIILAGQPELSERLLHPRLAQLRQRIAIAARLEALPPGEVVRYVQHRLQVARYEGPDLFSPAALELIAKSSRGIPRLINNICFSALSLGCAMRKTEIDAGVVKEAVEELSLRLPIPKSVSTQPQAARAVTASLRSSVESGFRRMQRSFLRRRIFSMALLLVAIGSLGIFLGRRTRSATLQPAVLSGLNSADSAAAQVPAPPVERHLADSVTGPTSPEIRQAVAAESSIKSFSYVIQPKDTLRDLCMSVLGRYDSAVLSEIRELNPDLKNPDHLDVGQEIRLPISATN